MERIVLASNNIHKIKEFKEILSQYEIVSLKDIGFLDEIEENGNTFEENSLIKAKAVYDFLKKNHHEMMVIADDSGLCCKSLQNEPGVRSARYAGNHDNQGNRDKLRHELKGKDPAAFFVCCITLIKNDEDIQQFVGTTDGKIVDEERGDTSFGYDCIFFSTDLDKTFGEATEEEKNRVSHRSRAIQKLVDALG